MTLISDEVTVGSFASAVGDVEAKPEDIAGFDDIWASVSPGADFASMGCGRFRRMSAPVETYVIDSAKQTLAVHGVAPADVDHLVFATTDATLGLIGRDFAVTTLTALGMVNCIPVIVSLQQCCSSLAAVNYGWRSFADEDVTNVVVVSFDFTPGDGDRIRPFALFGDAVASCLITRRAQQTYRLVSSAVNVDYDGLVGRDSFTSRQKVARVSLAKVVDGTASGVAGITKVFPTNLYKPLTLFNASVAGLHKSKLHFRETLYSYAHCGNCDWMLNLIDYQERVGVGPDETYLVQASAPGFFASTLLATV